MMPLLLLLLLCSSCSFQSRDWHTLELRPRVTSARVGTPDLRNIFVTNVVGDDKQSIDH